MIKLPLPIRNKLTPSTIPKTDNEVAVIVFVKLTRAHVTVRKLPFSRQITFHKDYRYFGITIINYGQSIK